MKFADPKNDLAFKKIFGDKNHTEVLISFLNSILDFSKSKQIKAVILANPYQVPKIKDLKETILDIKATNNNGEEFIVEMQVERDLLFAKRSLYYTSKSYINQIKKAEDYKKLKKVYFIGILDFAIFETPKYISRHLILNEKTHVQEVKDFEFNFIELKKFKLELSQCDTLSKKWIYFIKNADSLDVIPQEYANIQEFQTAFLSAKIYNWTDKELEIYDYISMQEGKRISELETAKLDGVKQGIEEEKENSQIKIEEEKIQIVKKAIKQGLDNQTISFITNMSISKIEKIRGQVA